MGQSSSRHRASGEVRPPIESASSPVASSSTRTPPPSRRATVRRSLLSFVKPGNEQPEGSTSTRREGLGSTKRSWRTSRRWSKAPESAVVVEPTAIPQSVVTTDASAPETEAAATLVDPEVPVALEEQSAKDGETSDAVVEVQREQVVPEESSSRVGDLESIHTLEEPISIPPIPIPTVEEPPAAQAIPPARGHFPPLGTLVVVQGMVHTTNTTPPLTEPSPESADLGSSSEAAQGPTAPSETIPTTPMTPDFEHPNHLDENPTSGISSSSVDVLATLLCVAAAATAASLLSGATDPIFPIPSPATGPVVDDPDAGTRVRNAWGNLRDRLGLTRTASNPPGDSPTVATGDQSNAREVMLAEMARAFNMGLGLTTSPSDTAAAPSMEGSTTPPIPGPDSFERFLIDLPGDLRAALTSGQVEPTPPPRPRRYRRVPMSTLRVPRSSVVSSPAPSGASSTRFDLGSPEFAASYPLPPTPPYSPRIGSVGDMFELPDSDDMLGLQDVTDSSDEEEEHGYVTEHDDEPTIASDEEDADAASTPPLPLPPSTETPSTSSRTVHTPGGGINWWRLYRFPPMPVNPTPATDTTAATPSALVPVILVGLQSMPRPRDGATDVQTPMGPLSDEELNPNPAGVDPVIPPVPTTEDDRPRGRRWAEAIRNMRPGRRAASEGASEDRDPGDAEDGQAPPLANTVGARTFLIYVVGGHYPPDHRIVTGVNTMDSFEALWELAEMIGQAKSPTATMDDIVKSGLEIIHSPDLARYEEEGKVSNNCVDRCLICLDDYEPEEDIRLMTCRHAFHKGCIDKWLSTGRNNCPACRSKGVSTGSAPPPTSAVDEGEAGVPAATIATDISSL